MPAWLLLCVGDLLKKDTRAQYAGWVSEPVCCVWSLKSFLAQQTLMHFAVEGAEMNMGVRVPLIEGCLHACSGLYITNLPPPLNLFLFSLPLSQDAGGDRLTKMVSVPDEVLGRQLDVILKLAQHGVPISEPDDRGRTPSFMACNDLEVRFLEGSLLLGTYVRT